MQLRQTEITEEQKALYGRRDRENRAFRPEEEVRYETLEVEFKRLDVDIKNATADLERRRRVAEKEMGTMSGGRQGDINLEKKCSTVAEMCFSIARLKKDNVRDARLDLLCEAGEMQAGSGPAGGYAIPTKFDQTLRMVQAQASVVRPRATVFPATDPPGAKLTIPTLDQTSAQNVYGGIEITHTGEGSTMVETDLKLRECTLEPKELTAYVVVTVKLLSNWSACGVFISQQLAAAMPGAEDFDFLRGSGVNRALAFSTAAPRLPTRVRVPAATRMPMWSGCIPAPCNVDRAARTRRLHGQHRFPVRCAAVTQNARRVAAP